MNKFWKLITSRLFIILSLIVVQLIVVYLFIFYLNSQFIWYSLLLNILSISLILNMINKNDNPAYKIVWICLIFVVPLAGSVFYLIFRKENTAQRWQKRTKKLKLTQQNVLPDNREIYEGLKRENPAMARQAAYIHQVTEQPVWQHTQTLFLSPGEKKYEQMLQELKKAEKFIFLEYFIIRPGIMWDSILEVLVEKVKQGVEVKLMYDDMGCANNLPNGYQKKLQDLGIETAIFNPLKAMLNGMMNNRDHRKICVIDGNVGFTGGVNLADEYINEFERFGYWKDASIMIRGEAVSSLTVMFLELWQYVNNVKMNFSNYLATESCENDGYVIPFDDSPFDNEQVGEMSYFNVINSAKRYIYISTPYLVLDNEMITMLNLAAKNGVEVRIVTPHIPDKPVVFSVTRSFYQPLIEAGVRIFEYTPGFIHSKTIVSDDQVAIVGTTNFDFRSFYLHYECGIWMYQSQAVQQVLEDYNDILTQCQEVTLERCRAVPWYKRIYWAVLRIFAPLM